MKLINIPFNKWSIDKFNAGLKTATSRTKAYGKTGDRFYIDGTLCELQFVAFVPLWYVAQVVYASEGAFTPLEFIDIWKEIHPRKGYVPEQFVYYHYFTKVLNDRNTVKNNRLL